MNKWKSKKDDLTELEKYFFIYWAREAPFTIVDSKSKHSLFIINDRNNEPKWNTGGTCAIQ